MFEPPSRLFFILFYFIILFYLRNTTEPLFLLEFTFSDSNRKKIKIWPLCCKCLSWMKTTNKREQNRTVVTIVHTVLKCWWYYPHFFLLRRRRPLFWPFSLHVSPLLTRQAHNCSQNSKLSPTPPVYNLTEHKLDYLLLAQCLLLWN